ncbi:MAG: glycosyltransferase [Prevotella sp.]|jgi:glycosyltransferase involved in cell wall biosynthesis|nr:glycosyltransferase [Prevotella sp.]
MSQKLSIIVPVYNVERYLERCIRSIVTQDVPAGKYELIVVNDGSTDGSREILSRLQREYPFIRIVDKENGGLSSARNEGLKYASGEYIFFIDSDDWIADDALPFLLEWIENYPVDILWFGACKVYDNGKHVSLATHLPPDNTVMLVEDYLTGNYSVRTSAWMSLFAKRLLDENNIRFKEGFLCEDEDFIVKVFSVARQFVCNNKFIYYYYHRFQSICNSTNSEKLIRDRSFILEELIDYIRPFTGKLRQGLDRKLCFIAVDTIRWLMRKNMPSKFIDETLKSLKNIGYYPLPKADCSLKFRLFRILFYYPAAVKLGRLLKKWI